MLPFRWHGVENAVHDMFGFIEVVFVFVTIHTFLIFLYLEINEVERFRESSRFESRELLSEKPKYTEINNAGFTQSLLILISLFSLLEF